MLLRHTTKEIIERNALTINPSKTCQPIGAMYAALGIHRCFPHSHGSQGCCSYHRSTLARHFKEPIIAASSSFTEGSSVFGGSSNLLQAIENIFTIYNPDVIAIHTTCLSETIGDDLSQIVSRAEEEGKIPPNKKVIYCNTPSYVGSHVYGYSNQVAAFVDFFSIRKKVSDNVNLIMGWMEPSDIREVKRICQCLNVNIIAFPDMSDVLDSPLVGKYNMYPQGGTKIQDMEATGGSRFTFGLGKYGTEEACRKLKDKCTVDYEVLDIPIGLKATDRFIDKMLQYSTTGVPESINAERGRLVDLIADSSKHFYGKRVALFGDPDTIIPLIEFLLLLDMKPTYVITGTPGKYFEERMNMLLGSKVPDAKIKSGSRADIFLLHQWIKENPVDLLIGNTYGKYIARDEDIPFIRIGFPIADRPGHNLFPLTGYNGAINIVTKILNELLSFQDRTCPEEQFEFQL